MSVASDFDQSKPQRRNVYICGFLSHRLHNDQLYTMARDLMVSFYVCTNPTAMNKWNKKDTTNLLSQCDAMIFWLNRYTLNDTVSLMTLQLATELNVHVIMVRHPRTRLVINPALDAFVEDGSGSGSTNGLNPDMKQLQYAVLEGYRQSLEYDRSKHQLCLQLLIKRLTSVAAGTSGHGTNENTSSTESTHTGSSENLLFENRYLRLPSLGSVDYRTFGTFTRSCSDGNVNFPTTVKATSQPHLSNGLMKQYRNSIVPSRIDYGGGVRRRRSLPRLIKLKRNQNSSAVEKSKNSNLDNVDNVDVKRCNLFDSTPDLTRPNYRSTDDPDLYHFTQYLVFPLTGKTHKPRVVNFPTDVLNRAETDLELESIWGSDVSLSGEADLADTLQGNLMISSPPPTPAPYIEPL